MKHYFILLALCSVLAVAQTPGVLTTEAVIKMVQSGVPNQTIIRTIQSAERVDFSFLPYDLALMERAGVPEEVFKAMAAKSAGRPIPGSSVSPPHQSACALHGLCVIVTAITRVLRSSAVIQCSSRKYRATF